jgi:ribosomal protein S18 acetylase RimI-like enzyme
MNLKPLKTTKQLIDAFSIISGLYPNKSEKEFLSQTKQMLKSSYKILGVFDDKTLIAVVGYRVGIRLYCGKYIHIDNLIVGENTRKQGIASFIIDEIKKIAKTLSCDTILADTQVSNEKAQKLFLKNGFYIRGFHLKCDNF